MGGGSGVGVLLVRVPLREVECELGWWTLRERRGRGRDVKRRVKRDVNGNTDVLGGDRGSGLSKDRGVVGEGT